MTRTSPALALAASAALLLTLAPSAEARVQPRPVSHAVSASSACPAALGTPTYVSSRPSRTKATRLSAHFNRGWMWVVVTANGTTTSCIYRLAR